VKPPPPVPPAGHPAAPKLGDRVCLSGEIQEINAETAIVALTLGGLAAVPLGSCVRTPF
jgi:hypothetical protein